MVSTPSRSLKPAPSSSSPLPASTKSPAQNRTHLSLKRIIGHTCDSPAAFDTSGRLFAYVAGGTIVVVDVEVAPSDLQGIQLVQRFYRARPTAVPVLGPTTTPQPSSSAVSRVNDARNRSAKGSRDSRFGSPDLGDLPSSSRTWTSRERIKAMSCVALSRDGRFLAAGETGYAPRVLIFSLNDTSSDRPLVSISEHGYGVKAVAWSGDGRWLASLGTANDGFLMVWKIDPRTGSARLFQQNRCTSSVAGMVWLGTSLVTFGLRHVKAWKVVDELQRPPLPSKRHRGADTPSSKIAQKTLPGRKVLLGSLQDSSFTCATSLEEDYALLCSDGGDVCLLDGTSDLVKLVHITNLGFHITSCALRRPAALTGGKNGQVVSLDVDGLLDCASIVTEGQKSGAAVLAMGYVQDRLVTIDSDRSIDIWHAGILPEFSTKASSARHQLPGQNGPVLGVQSLRRAGESSPAFLTWSGSGKVLVWDLSGNVRYSLDISVGKVHIGYDREFPNQLCVVRADEDGALFAAGDRYGVLQVVDHATGRLLLKTKAHASDITNIAVHCDASKAVVASSGRDRTVQLFHRTSGGSFELFQTLDFPARVTHLIFSSGGKMVTCSMDRVIQVHELVHNEREPTSLAAIHCRSIALKACPTSMAMDADGKSLFVSKMDRSVYLFNVETGRPLSAFKCIDENGETAVLDSLALRSPRGDESSLLLGLSNTDKSVRIYNSSAGTFVDREWGHAESINGVALVDDEDTTHKVVSVGCDGTIMIFDLAWIVLPPSATSRSPSPAKEAALGSSRPPLRRVLSKAELAEFPRPSSSHHDGRRSSPRVLRSQQSKGNMSSGSVSHILPLAYASPAGSVTEQSPSRETASRSDSPTTDTSPTSTRSTRGPSLPALGSSSAAQQAAREESSLNVRSSDGFETLQVASEVTCRQLRAYRKKLALENSVTPEALGELEAELHLTSVALGERMGRSSQPVTEHILSSLLDQYSERLVSMLDEKLGLRLQGRPNGNGTLAVEDGLALLRPATTADPERRWAADSTTSASDT